MSEERSRILVVEDQRIIAADLESTLRKLGYAVVGTASTGEDAVRKAVELRPDLVLMDIRLRGDMDGIEAAGIIRERADVPVVYLTAYADEETILRAKLTTPFGYVVKPFNERELRAGIEIALYKRDFDRAFAEERARRLVAEESRLLVESLEEYGIFRLDPHGRISSWNAGAERIEGYAGAEMIGHDFSVLFADAHAPRELLERALREGRAEVEGWRTRKGGARYWAQLTLTTLRSGAGALAGFAVLVHDLSERRAYEEALKESEQRFRMAIVHAPVPMMVHAEDGEVLAVSEAVVRATGYPRERLRRSDDWLDLAYRERAPEIRALLVKAFDGAPPPPAELAVRIASGATRQWLFSISNPVVLGEGRRALVVVAVDVTNQRRAEEALKEQHRQKDEFIAMLGHELRNPLAAVRSATELLKLMTRGDPRYQRTQDVLERQTEHMAKLVDGLLDVSRLVRGRIVIERDTVDVRTVLQEVIRDRMDQLQHLGLELRVEIDECAFWVDGDRVRLAQVFDNILANALKFTDAPGRITVSARCDGEQAVVSVRDTGSGIDPELLPDIFEPFRQGEQSLGRTAGGLGLGLAIVKNVVELHGGTVSATSRPGEGTELTVRLPLTVAPADVPDHAEVGAWPARVLIVEDNEDAADTLRCVLQTLGNEVDVAYDGEAGVQTARDFAPEVILCDIGLPGAMNGYDVARALRESGNDAFLVAVTGYGRPEDVRRAREVGFDAHLTKPIDVETVEALISEHRRATH